MHIRYGLDKYGESWKVLSIPATPKEAVEGRCGHEFDCCGCTFVMYVRHFLNGLFSITGYGRNV